LVIAYEMGAASLMSTPAADHTAAPFSGKLCSVMSTCEDKNRIEPATQPAEGEQIIAAQAPLEIGGRKGPEPTRYGDWELRGRCIDF
jgi:hypothetical protein